jgi:hypothetical protein
MNTPNLNPEDGQLSSLLQESRPTPGLPPRFQENVWRRIEQKHAEATATSWVESLAALVLKPRFVLASVCGLVVAGALLGSLNGTAHARHDAQERYVSSVAMTMAQ